MPDPCYVETRGKIALTANDTGGSNVIEVYRRDPVSGSLTLTSRLTVKKPVCIQFVTTAQ